LIINHLIPIQAQKFKTGNPGTFWNIFKNSIVLLELPGACPDIFREGSGEKLKTGNLLATLSLLTVEISYDP